MFAVTVAGFYGVRCDGFAPKVIAVTQEDVISVSSLDVRLRPTGTLRGVVLDLSGRPVPGILIEGFASDASMGGLEGNDIAGLLGPAAADTGIRTRSRTDAEGKFEWSHFASGKAFLELRNDVAWMVSSDRVQEVPEGQVRETVIVVTRIGVAAVVLRADEEPKWWVRSAPKLRVVGPGIDLAQPGLSSTSQRIGISERIRLCMAQSGFCLPEWTVIPILFLQIDAKHDFANATCRVEISRPAHHSIVREVKIRPIDTFNAEDAEIVRDYSEGAEENWSSVRFEFRDTSGQLAPAPPLCFVGSGRTLRWRKQERSKAAPSELDLRLPIGVWRIQPDFGRPYQPGLSETIAFEPRDVAVTGPGHLVSITLDRKPTLLIIEPVDPFGRILREFHFTSEQLSVATAVGLAPIEPGSGSFEFFLTRLSWSDQRPKSQRFEISVVPGEIQRLQPVIY